jgi:hypothetical protein
MPTAYFAPRTAYLQWWFMSMLFSIHDSCQTTSLLNVHPHHWLLELRCTMSAVRLTHKKQRFSTWKQYKRANTCYWAPIDNYSKSIVCLWNAAEMNRRTPARYPHAARSGRCVCTYMCSECVVTTYLCIVVLKRTDWKEQEIPPRAGYTWTSN